MSTVMKRLRHAWITRLVAATVSIAFALSSFIGATAHAGSYHHSAAAHHHVVAAADHFHSNTAPSISPIGAVDPAEPAHKHSGCMDFICHGGLAVLAAATSWQLTDWSPKPVFRLTTVAVALASPSRLDRPPKPLVSA